MLCVRYLRQAALAFGVSGLSTDFSRPVFLVQLLFLQEILSRSRHFVLGVDLDEILVEAQTGKRVQ